jgi:predicted O-methyltransferase YrrM
MTDDIDIVHPGIENYLLHLGERGGDFGDPVLSDMEALARRRDFPAVGPLVGRLLSQLARMIGARRILELGSGFGYSAWWFAQGMEKDGEIFCTDGSSENARQAALFFQRAGLSDRIRFQVGDALDVIGKIPGEFDIIFNDIDKEDYPRAFQAAIPRLRKGGLLICDNVLWFGRVITGATDSATAGVREFNRLTHSTPGIVTSILPIRDGVSVSLKL